MKIASVFVICGILQFFLPWWTILIVTFCLAAILAQTPKQALCMGFFSITALWLIACLVQSVPNDHLLALRVAVMLKLNHAWLLITITVLLGGILAAVSGLCGYYFRENWLHKAKVNDKN